MESRPEAAETTGQKILKFIWKIIPFIIVLLIIGLIILPLSQKITSRKKALAQKQSSQKADIKPLTNVITLELIPAMLMEKLSLPGVAKPWISLEVVSEIRGKIIKKKISEGRHVNKGDVLAVIDKSDYQNTYNSSLASYENAMTNKKRLTALVQKNFVTKSRLDEAVARVKNTRALYENAKLNLSRCTILSPMKGIVDRIHIENGTYLNPGDPVVRIIQIDQLKVTVGIPESDVAAVRKLKIFDMTIDALKGKSYKGFYHYLHKTTDNLARLYTLEIRVNNQDGQILPDMFARVTIIKNKEPLGIAVPMYCLVTLNKTTGVYVEDKGMVHFRPVVTGFQDGWKIQIAKGLLPGETIVAVGQRLIEDGEQVHVTKTIRDMEALTR